MGAENLFGNGWEEGGVEQEERERVRKKTASAPEAVYCLKGSCCSFHKL